MADSVDALAQSLGALRLDGVEFAVTDVPGDGNCFFYALCVAYYMAYGSLEGLADQLDVDVGVSMWSCISWEPIQECTTDLEKLYTPFSDCFRYYLWQRAEVAGQHPVIHAFFTNLIQPEVLPDTVCTEEEVKKWGVDLGLSDEVATLVAKLARDDDYTFEHFHADYATQVLGTSGVWVDESVIMFVQHVLQDLGITLTIHDTPEYRTTTRCESRTVNLLLKDNHYQALT